jgi:hypothetical protein
MNCSDIPTSVRRTDCSSTVATESETFGDLKMKMYILALATLLAAAGSASASNDHIGCDWRSRMNHGYAYESQYCGNQNSDAEQRANDRSQLNGGSQSLGNGNSQN